MKTDIPSYINCPLRPAQSFKNSVRSSREIDWEKTLWSYKEEKVKNKVPNPHFFCVSYKCSAGHKSWLKIEENNEREQS